MKAGVPCCVDPHQKAEALEVIARRGQELGSHPVLAPALQDLQWPDGLKTPKLGLYGEVQTHNASLAVALTTQFLAASGGETEGEERARAVVRGLETTEWPGRSQLISRDSVQFYLDGAHTEESMVSCHQWFSQQALATTDTDSSRVSRVLIFNTTGDREVRCLLAPLARLQLDLVIFCTNISRQSSSVDQQNFNTNYQIQVARCETHSQAWRDLTTAVPCLTVPCYDEAVLALTASRVKELADLQADCRPSPPLSIPGGVSQAETLQILVTGSLHLVGAVLGLLQTSR